MLGHLTMKLGTVMYYGDENHVNYDKHIGPICYFYMGIMPPKFYYIILHTISCDAAKNNGDK